MTQPARTVGAGSSTTQHLFSPGSSTAVRLAAGNPPRSALVILVVVALLGFTMLARWLAGRRTAAAGVTASGDTTLPAEQRFPIPVVVVHGLLGAATLVLVLVAALSI
jgi:hypothetical protein